MRKAYKEKHDYLLEQLTCFESTFDFSGENAGLHILLTAKEEIPAKELITAAEEEGIKIYGVSDSLLGNVNEKYLHTVMLGYGALEKDEIKEGIDKLKLAWKNYI